jgi:hypothetical protein
MAAVCVRAVFFQGGLSRSSVCGDGASPAVCTAFSAAACRGSACALPHFPCHLFAISAEVRVFRLAL